MGKANGKVARVFSATSMRETTLTIKSMDLGFLTGPAATCTKVSIEKMKGTGLER